MPGLNARRVAKVGHLALDGGVVMGARAGLGWRTAFGDIAPVANLVFNGGGTMPHPWATATSSICRFLFRLRRRSWRQPVPRLSMGSFSFCSCARGA